MSTNESRVVVRPWRVWVDGDEVRVARDLVDRGKPVHLALSNGRIGWFPHRQGAVIPAISLADFTAWLDQGGHLG